MYLRKCMRFLVVHNNIQYMSGKKATPNENMLRTSFSCYCGWCCCCISNFYSGHFTVVTFNLPLLSASHITMLPVKTRTLLLRLYECVYFPFVGHVLDSNFGAHFTCSERMPRKRLKQINKHWNGENFIEWNDFFPGCCCCYCQVICIRSQKLLLSDGRNQSIQILSTSVDVICVAWTE